MAQTDSNIAAATLLLQGVWLHDPTDPTGTAAQYLHTPQGSRNAQIDLGGTELQFVGRELPVFEFGELRHEPAQVTVQVPHGTGWASQVAALRATARSGRVWCYRDNRGRKVFGVLTGYRETDQQYGTAVDFAVNAADFTEAV